ncbi:MAG: bifunctional methylenetetrahydrofolate dehydrogenase/methenyltetrahydrofolate cyclohydrolase FolD [Erysipelotrichaceae bacterium]|nr:bifunctional methylenetetrahydrofolate dehydrogenase/methenyltetrahydrofolate cyclohydrolase FolD [Erysipelotrichaceae bacterium]MBQ1810862.1 bifunctional methylenetetrahydrofolate dehydrogenase/methenyltetrahydrofolate cyclohydrolase FolD [Erysipelotrichaceae bacterium]
MRIVYGSELSLRLKGELKEKLLGPEFKRKPKLAVVLAGDNPASLSYVKGKGRACEEVGMDFILQHYPEDVSEEELLKAVSDLNADDGIDGIIVQLPLPKGLNEKKILDTIDPAKDVDGLHPVNTGKLFLGEKDGFVPCTAQGVVALLKEMGEELCGKNAVIIGRSKLVGMPLTKLLLNENCTVTVCHSRTQELAKIASQADILVVAIGKPRFVTAEYIKEGACVVDVGVNRVDGKLCGDVDFENVKDKCKAITPVPKGVGPMTITMLLENTARAYLLRKEK